MNLKTLTMIPSWDWPEEADQLLLEVLRNDRADAADRLVAADLAGDLVVINDELAEVLLAILGNSREAEDLRAGAAISLGPVLEHAFVFEFDDPDEVPITEQTFLRIQESLRKLYLDAGVPKLVRRRVLEGAVRAPQDWHQDAIRAAYTSGDEEWQLTAVFAMRWVKGFDEQIMEALESDDEEVFYQAICAAGSAELEPAWPYVSEIIELEREDKELLLAAIEAVPCIRPQAAAEMLMALTTSDDEDIVMAAHEAMVMANGLMLADSDFDDEEWEDEDPLF
jgi:hypothetical protein